MLFSPSKCFLTLFHSFSYLPAARNLPCAGVRPRNALDKKNKLTHTYLQFDKHAFSLPPLPRLSLSFCPFFCLSKHFLWRLFPWIFIFRCLQFAVAAWQIEKAAPAADQRDKETKPTKVWLFFYRPPHSCRICIMRCASNWWKLLYPAGEQTQWEP